MMRHLSSLRGQLIASMLFVFLVGIGGARLLDPHIAALAGVDLDFAREPYQDILVLIAFSLGAIALIWLVSGLSLRRLEEASREAATVGPANLNARISTARLHREVRPLVDAVNAALDRLTEAYATERRFVANAAHQLRTPLAVLKLRLQRTKLDGIVDWSAIEQDVAHLSRLVDQLLDLARKEHASDTAGTAVNLARIAREAAASMSPMIERSGRELEVDLPDTLTVAGRRDDLSDMVRNLIENALVHGQGTIRLVGGAGQPDMRPECWVMVGDEGPGIPDEQRAEMFERFRKGHPQSPGHGLGLAIAREVARGHRGSVAFVPGPECRVEVVLPLNEAAGSRTVAQSPIKYEGAH